MQRTAIWQQYQLLCSFIIRFLNFVMIFVKKKNTLKNPNGGDGRINDTSISYCCVLLYIRAVSKGLPFWNVHAIVTYVYMFYLFKKCNDCL